MKCWSHPEQDAVAFCKSCGKGICKNCAVVVRGDIYCKACIESDRVVAVAPSAPTVAEGVESDRVVAVAPSAPTVAEGMPMPTGTPSKAFFVVGGVGCIVISLAAMWRFFGIFAPTLGYPLSEIIGYILLVIGLILTSVGYLGMRRNYGSGVGTASFAVGIVVSVLFILWSIWLSVEYAYGYPSYQWYLEFSTNIWAIFIDAFFAMMILWAVTHIKTRRFTGKSGLSLATGIMLIITAVFLETYAVFCILAVFWQYYQSAFIGILDAIWSLSFFGSEILATISFFTAKIPESPAKPSH